MLSTTNDTEGGDGAEPVRRFELATDDPDRAVDIVCDTYADVRMRICGSRERFFYHQCTLAVGALAMDEVISPIGIHLECPSLIDLCFAAVHRARSDVRTGRQEVELVDGDTVVYPVGEMFTATARDLDSRTLRLPVATVAARAGVSPDRFRFTAMTPNSTSLGRYFRATMQYAYEALREPDTALAHPLVLAGAIDAIAGAALATFPHNCDPDGDRLRRAWPSAIRRAAAYIDANPAQPITLSDIAAAAAISVRALQAGFQRHLGTTPMLYLREVRLAHAHHDLQSADPTHGADVAAIARRWGFGHLGRFAGYYRATYGHPPRHTLRS